MTKRTIVTTVIIVCAVAVLALGVAVWKIATSQVGAVRFVARQTLDEGGAAVVPALLGMESPRTLLILFLNNTEIRPGGGFIGSFGVATVDHGAVTSLYTDGTENLDRAALTQTPIDPPQPIKDHLISRWFFRDSNWSPDFVESAQNALKFYAAENGPQASSIQTVVGVTPEVLETIMKYTGPVTARGKVYTAENITDLLEQTVEVDFHEQGIPKTERKAIIGEIAAEVTSRAKHISPLQWPSLLADMQELIAEHHVIIYDKDPAVQKNLDELGWSGRIQSGAPDSVMFVDANLASLKTDRVMERKMRYDIFKTSGGEWHGRITTTYRNTGSFDWRTTRYNTYTRWYLPAGTKFISGTGSQLDFKHPDQPAPWDVTTAGDKTVIGSFFVIEPGAEKSVTIDVALAPQVVSAIRKGEYGLRVQKQLGTQGFELTVHGEFGTSVKGAVPPEPSNKFGDQSYDWTGFLKKDALFEVSL